MTGTGDQEDDRTPVLPGRAPSHDERCLDREEPVALPKRPDEWARRDELPVRAVHQSVAFPELWEVRSRLTARSKAETA